MRIERRYLHYTTTAETDVLDITADVEQFVHQANLPNGVLLAFVTGSTAALTTIEFESGAVADLKRAIDRIAPRDLAYEHDQRWHDGNGYSHVRAALLGPSLALAVMEGKVQLGTWQQVVLCDFDNRPRRRRVILQIMGE